MEVVLVAIFVVVLVDILMFVFSFPFPFYLDCDSPRVLLYGGCCSKWFW